MLRDWLPDLVPHELLHLFHRSPELLIDQSQEFFVADGAGRGDAELMAAPLPEGRQHLLAEGGAGN